MASVALGIAVAAVAFFSHLKAQPTDAELIAEELRANGAIVENYYQVIGSSHHLESPQSRRVRLGSYISAAALVAAGGALILKASR